MQSIFNRKSQKRQRQYLRNNATDAERALWSRLKAKQLLGFKFRRQHGIGPFILDFYCPEKKLAIEVDGATHSTEQELEHDRHKQEVIEKFGIRVLRFTNHDVYDNLDGVTSAIAAAIEEQEDWQRFHPRTRCPKCPSSVRRGAGVVD